jgi:hypothetical protein
MIFKKIEKKLNIQINVICAENLNDDIYYGKDKEVRIYIYKIKNHFHVINSIAGFYGYSYYCNTHKQKHNNKDDCPKCKKDNDFCRSCWKKHLVLEYNWKQCDKCFRKFPNQECFDNHKEKVCEIIWKCLKCSQVVNWNKYTPETHKCGHKNV